MQEPTVSVLMAVYEGTPAEQLELALGSVAEQTRPADEVVIVEDGPISQRHLDVLCDFETRLAHVTRLRLPVNRGQGMANQAGLAVATGTWIAKADADDISMPHRFERQLHHLRETNADVCGAALLEFAQDHRSPIARRDGPLMHEQIARRMRLNNPVNHPTAMFRRAAALRAGGYPDMRFAEDYVLFARMWAAGARFTNLPDPLVYFRADTGMHERRALRGQLGDEWRLQQELRRVGVVSARRRWWNFAVRLGYRSLPLPIRRVVHERLLGRKAGAEDSDG